MRVVVGIITDNERNIIIKKNNPDWQKVYTMELVEKLN